ncbi:MAG: flagellar biosynthetic protein FliP [Planctomycetaceae bacterium]
MCRSVARSVSLLCLVVAAIVCGGGTLSADGPVIEPESALEAPRQVESLLPGVEEALAPEKVTTTVRLALLVTVLSLVPSVLAMTTCYVRFLVVLGLLRQAMGAGQLLSNQVLAALCLFLTVTVMAPVWQQAWDEGVAPYTEATSPESRPSLDDSVTATLKPIRRFMSLQIQSSENIDAVFLLLDYQRPAAGSPAAASWVEPTTFDEVPISVLLPSYLLSELKIAFTIGFLVFLPFVVIDMVVSSLLVSTGMMMLPPVLVSLPLKLLLFVMIDGWFLTVGMLLESVRTVPVAG